MTNNVHFFSPTTPGSRPSRSSTSSTPNFINGDVRGLRMGVEIED